MGKVKNQTWSKLLKMKGTRKMIMKPCTEERLKWILKTHGKMEEVQAAQELAMGKVQEMWEMMADQITEMEDEIDGLRKEIMMHKAHLKSSYAREEAKARIIKDLIEGNSEKNGGPLG